MKTLAALILAFCCCSCEPQISKANGEAYQHSTSCDVCSLTSIAQNLGAMGEKIAYMADKISFLETKLQNTEKEVLELRNLTGGNVANVLYGICNSIPRVAFSATLRESGTGNIGPFTTATPLKYKKVFSNTGSCYNPSTGIFTAQIKGMYFFRFSMMNNLESVPNSAVSLVKNGEWLSSVWDSSGDDAHDMGSNAVVISLEVGDSVYVELVANKVVYDDTRRYNTFSGFLLFPM
uniref:Complement C1q-like protein 2 n=1 Tax=Acanthochromis polyacanthus TaxID=80966 RepID=A0A3Q1FRA1_9TELE